MDRSGDWFDLAHSAGVEAHRCAGKVLARISDIPPNREALSGGLVEPVSSRFPDHPLDTAVHDMAIATLAIGRAAEATNLSDDVVYTRRLGEAARVAAGSLSTVDRVATVAESGRNTELHVRMAHAVANSAFIAADLTRPVRRRASSRSKPGFPPSWGRLIDLLGRTINDCGDVDESQRPLLIAAAAARDGADAARRAYDQSDRGVLHPAVLRFVRVAALASAYAGCAAVQPIRRAATRQSV